MKKKKKTKKLMMRCAHSTKAVVSSLQVSKKKGGRVCGADGVRECMVRR